MKRQAIVSTKLFNSLCRRVNAISMHINSWNLFTFVEIAKVNKWSYHFQYHQHTQHQPSMGSIQGETFVNTLKFIYVRSLLGWPWFDDEFLVHIKFLLEKNYVDLVWIRGFMYAHMQIEVNLQFCWQEVLLECHPVQQIRVTVLFCSQRTETYRHFHLLLKYDSNKSLVAQHETNQGGCDRSNNDIKYR